MAPAHETHVVGVPLPPNPVAQQEVLAAIADNVARFRAQRPVDGQGVGTTSVPEGHDKLVHLNWGPEGNEGPLLAIGRSLISLSTG